MFTKKGYRRRTALAMGFAFVGQSTGVLVVNNYGPTLYATLGYGTSVQFHLLQMSNSSHIAQKAATRISMRLDHRRHCLQRRRRTFHG